MPGTQPDHDRQHPAPDRRQRRPVHPQHVGVERRPRSAPSPGFSTRLARNSSASGTVIDEKPYPSAPLTMAARSVMRASATVWADMRTYHMILGHENARTADGGRRGRRPPDRLAAPQRHLRHRHQGQRGVRGAAIHDRPHQRRAVVHLDAHHRAGRAGAAAGARGARRARLPDRQQPRRALVRRRQRRLRARRFLLDDQPPDVRPARRPVARGRAAADGRGHRRSTGGRAVCRKLRDVRAGDAVVCGVDGIRVDAGVPGARSPRLRVHDQRDLVRAARRGRRRAHRRDDARRSSGAAAASPSSPDRSSCTPAACRTSAS